MGVELFICSKQFFPLGKELVEGGTASLQPLLKFFGIRGDRGQKFYTKPLGIRIVMVVVDKVPPFVPVHFVSTSAHLAINKLLGRYVSAGRTNLEEVSNDLEENRGEQK
ncbi:hypothetical protein PHLCEN_2v2128 [Hermanssonia centrifuga]|uniref:Uncharacterized protein n=1 Tax=Hermanssonia centrifuga TaxID=98765 RepID=A0A2R6RPY7_9APHY|nr:hypothetical protein PHLCEN_2v2128 [Hermanssonia centrifuga]